MSASVRDRFAEACRTWPASKAIEMEAGTLTYGELDGLTVQAAGLLTSAGLRRTVIAILMSDPAAQIGAMLAVLRAGAVFCFLDPRLPVQRLADMAETAAPAAVVTDEGCSPLCRSLFETGEARLFFWEARSGMRPLRPGAGGGQPAMLADTRLGAPCYVYFTSGSTGRPKAVLGQENGLSHFIDWEIETFGLCHDDRVSQFTLPTFDVYLRDIFTALCAGGTVCLLPDRDLLLDPDGLAGWIDRSGVTLVHCVPSLLRGLLLAQLDPGRFRRLKRILLAGEPLLPSDVNRWTGIFGDRIELVNLYGPTETTLAKFCYRVPPGEVATRYVPVGKPIRGAQAVLLQESLDPCRRGDVGELYIRTPFRSLGYFNEPALTAQAFIQNPFSKHPDDLLYRTGDLATELPDGSYRLTGRKDFQVKIHGMRVELGEIEATFAAHPGIAEAVVVAHEHAPGDLRLSAFCTARTEPGEQPGDGDGGIALTLAAAPRAGGLPACGPGPHAREDFIGAGERGDDLVAAAFPLGFERLAEGIALYRTARLAHGTGRSDGRVTVLLHALVTEEGEAACAGAGRTLADHLRSDGTAWQLDGGAAMPDEYAGTVALIGSVEACLDRVRMLEAAGVDEIACWTAWAGPDAAARTAERLGELERRARTGRPSLRRLTRYLQSRLPAFMIPPEIAFVDSLPLNPNGKIDRRALAARRGARSRDGGSHVPPRTELERTLVDLWAATLDLPAARIGIDDNFFALGGHSMLAVRLVNRIRSELRFELPVRGLFEAPTIALLAERIAILGGAASAQGVEDREGAEYSEGIL